MSLDNAVAPAAGKCPVSHIGEKFDPLDAITMYEFYAEAREQEPVFYSPQLDMWVVTKYDDILTIMQDSETFSANNVLELYSMPCPAALDVIGAAGVKIAPSLVDEDPPIHTRHRQALRRPFTPDRVKDLEPLMLEIIDKKLDEIAERGEADLIDDFMYEIPALVLFHMMGIPTEDIPVAKSFIKRLAVFGFGFPDEAEQVEQAQNLADYWDYIKGHVVRLMENPGDDVMSQFIAQLQLPKNADLWDQDYVQTIMMQLTFAGQETTVNASGGMFRALLENRDQWDQLVADTSLVSNTVEESLRFYTPVPQWKRRTTKPVNIGGVDLPAGQDLLIAIGSANHDGEHFEDSEEFDITRENSNKHMAFGWGRHRCLGEGVARLEMRLALERLVARLPHIELVPDQKWEFSPNVGHRGPDHVRVTWDVSKNPPV